MSLHLADEPGDGHRGPVGVGHEQATHHDLVELGVCATGQKLVQLEGTNDQD